MISLRLIFDFLFVRINIKKRIAGLKRWIIIFWLIDFRIPMNNLFCTAIFLCFCKFIVFFQDRYFFRSPYFISLMQILDTIVKDKFLLSSCPFEITKSNRFLYSSFKRISLSYSKKVICLAISNIEDLTIFVSLKMYVWCTGTESVDLKCYGIILSVILVVYYFFSSLKVIPSSIWFSITPIVFI